MIAEIVKAYGIKKGLKRRTHADLWEIVGLDKENPRLSQADGEALLSPQKTN